MKRLPIGFQTFSKIINENCLYVDKTEDIYNLISSGECYFISRPRRFGKSLLISTLKEIFSGSKELFKGLYIYDKIKWEKYPVVHIDFSSIVYEKDRSIFEKSLSRVLKNIGTAYEITIEAQELKEQFDELIRKLGSARKVVVLIDEYDKPIVDHITDTHKAQENREVLREFYSVLKGCDGYLRFVFITGVSKFAKVSIFSGLNNLEDITLDRRFAKMTGITQEELEEYFLEHLSVLQKQEEIAKDDLLEDIRYWYNGYSWNGKDMLYNPFSLLNLFSSFQFRNYWFATGTPTFLINLLKDQQFDIPQLEQATASEYLFDSYDIDNLEMVSLLFQTGYLTIKNIIRKERRTIYQLSYPNYEVKESLLNYIMAGMSGQPVTRIQPLHIDLHEALEREDMDQFIGLLKSIFAGIPSHLQTGQNGFYYHSLFYLILSLMGAKIDLEVLTDKGRIDAVLELEDKIYRIEFKLDSAQKALSQIKTRKYYEKYLQKTKDIYLLGVGGFAEREINYAWERA